MQRSFADLLKEIEKLSKSPNLDQESTCAPLGHKLKTRDKIGQEYNLSKNSVARYLRISKLPKDSKELVDTGQIAIRAGVDLSYLREESLDIVHAIVTEENFKIDMNRARNLRGADKKALTMYYQSIDKPMPKLDADKEEDREDVEIE